ncbi:hypothetical protein E4U13_005787 [Claviceps humidiphila]|uniref:Myb/SANT-like domain-containing protein n=1 Tax=Claviceps humidiphila TaxID=1294629 RepID=A0A9P7PVU8_9HYPO|nr:hypothetical protein E4U13_005787 [Claviceps humidiphila]
MAKGSRWSLKETLLLLELLLQARRDHLLDSDKVSVLREVLENFIPTFSTEYPRRKWTAKILENRVTYLKNTWRAFRAAETRSGTTYHEDTGMLQMSKQSADYIVSVYKRYGKIVVTKPLPVSDSMSPSEWGEIFFTDPPAGKTVIGADDDEGFANAAREDAGEEGGQSTEQGQEDAETQDNDAGDESPEEDSSDEDLLDLRPSPPRANTSTPAPSRTTPAPSRTTPAPSTTARPAARSSRNTPATPAPPTGQPNRMSRSLQQKRIEAQSSELSQVISNVFGSGIGGTKKHEISARSPGADDFEKASKDCQLLFEEFGVRTMMKVIKWLKEDPMNAPMWNSLSSKEAKIVAIEDISGVELSREI